MKGRHHQTVMKIVPQTFFEQNLLQSETQCCNLPNLITLYKTINWFSSKDINIVTCYLRSKPIRDSLLGNSFVNTQQYWSRC
jgi:hypothetical protein